MAKDKKQCFIIMPITTPKALLEVYRDGAEHFVHVLNCLLIPGVVKAGFKARPPIARGADLIHANIIKNLETADLVLCDMSGLNPNVFFEFGMRTALNKPLCVVKDEQTKEVPFDTGILNYHQYASSLEPWEIEKEISKLAEHVAESATGSKGGNDLWRYFGMKSEAKAYEGATGTDAKLDLIMRQMNSIIQRTKTTGESVSNESQISNLIYATIPPGTLRHVVIGSHPNPIVIYLNGPLNEDTVQMLARRISRFGRSMSFHQADAPPPPSPDSEIPF